MRSPASLSVPSSSRWVVRSDRVVLDEPSETPKSCSVMVIDMRREGEGGEGEGEKRQEVYCERKGKNR